MKSKYVLLVIVIAAIMAIAAFITISLWIQSPETPAVEDPAATPLPGVEGEAPAGNPIQIDGVTVFLDVDPADEVFLRQVPDGALVQPTAVAVQPTATTPPQDQTQPVAPTATSTPLPPPPPAVGPVPGAEAIVFVQYTVQPEDTLYRITEKQSTSIELMATNGIDSNDLVVGETLSLPVANTNYCAASAPYVVRPGDTVFSIANRFNTTTARLAEVNGLGADFRINIAAVLCIP